jgi:hypothetical protein
MTFDFSSIEIRSFNEAAGTSDGPDNGVYSAVVVEVEDPEFYAFPDSKLSPEEVEAKRKWVTRFVFEIENDDDWAGTRLRSNRIAFGGLHEKSNNYKLWKALTDDKFDPDHKYRPSEAKGQRCQITVQVNERGYSDIVGFLPTKKVRGARTINSLAGEPANVEEIPF